MNIIINRIIIAVTHHLRSLVVMTGTVMSAKSVSKVYKAIINRANILTEHVKLIFGKNHKFFGQ